MSPNFEQLEDRRLLAAAFAAGTLTVTMTGGADNVSANITGGILTVNMSDGPADVRSAATVIFINVQLGGGADTVNMGNVTMPVSVFGSSGNDTIVGGNGNDTLQGGDGNDSINGAAGFDRIDGGALGDTIAGGGHNDTADYSGRSANITADLDGVQDDGQAGELDRIMGDVESIMGGSGNDTLTGNAFGNYLSGGAGADSLSGGAGNDVLVGGAGVDSMYGNDDNDSIFALDGEIDVVNGGPGSDAAQTDPAEGAPVPGEDVVIPAEPVSAFVGPVSAQVFSTRPLAKRPAPAARRSGTGAGTGTGTGGIVSSGENLAPLGPAPGGPGGFAGDAPQEVERPITDAEIEQLGTQLAPYAFGQVIVTRRFQGQVTIGGTAGNDDIVVQHVIGADGPVVDIFVNGGVTRYILPTPTLTLANKTGQDILSVIGDGEADATLAPSPEAPNQGQITFGSHQILYGQAGLLAPTLNFSRLFDFTLVTPQPADIIQLASVDPNNPNSEVTGISAYSGQFALPAVQLTRVDNLTLDIATGEQAGAANDQVVVNTLPKIAPTLTLLPTRYPLVTGGGEDTLVVNGRLEFANNPMEYPGVTRPNLHVDVNTGGAIRFHAPTTELGSLDLAAGGTAALAPGDKTLYVHGLQMALGGGTVPGATLNLSDGNLIVDHDGSATVPAYVRQRIVNAYNPQGSIHWNMPGITSTFAAADATTALGYAESLTLFDQFGGSFRGNRIDGSATLVSYTLIGDANLDREVNFVDLVTLAQNYEENPGSQVWTRGDFNYDGNNNFSDLVLLAQNYNRRLFT